MNSASFRPIGRPLDHDRRRMMTPFFTPDLLDKIRIVALEGRRISNPPFYAEAKAQGLNSLPEFTHMASLTFEDVVVFHGEIAARTLFHALVHAVQFEVLGLERYTELFVRGFLRTRSHISVPLETHGFTLESKFAGDPAQTFLSKKKCGCGLIRDVTRTRYQVLDTLIRSGGCASHRHPARCSLCLPGEACHWRGHWLRNRLRASAWG